MESMDETRAYLKRIKDMENEAAEKGMREILKDPELTDRYRRLRDVMGWKEDPIEDFIKTLYKDPGHVTEEWVSLLEKVNNK